MKLPINDLGIILLAIFLALIFATKSYAQDTVQEDKISYKKKTTIDFSDKTIEVYARISSLRTSSRFALTFAISSQNLRITSRGGHGIHRHVGTYGGSSEKHVP